MATATPAYGMELHGRYGMTCHSSAHYLDTEKAKYTRTGTASVES